MKPLNKNGFTIIETVLFLGISGMLIVGILVGTGTSINVQRYHDSVTSFRAFLQQQYSDVSNVNNGRSATSGCNGTDSQRGQSDCVILGKFITTTDGESFSVKSVIGTIPVYTPSDPAPSGDVEALKDYSIRVSGTASSYDLEWGALIKKSDDTELLFSMLVLRSPVSGITRTFVDNAHIDDGHIDALLSTPLTNTVRACINSNGLFTGSKMAVFINANTTSANGIETRGDDSGCQ